MKIKNNDIFKGNYSEDKYQSKNPISRMLVKSFLKNILELSLIVGKDKKVHEIGCGEGQLSGLLASNNFVVRGTDIREESLKIAKEEALRNGLKIDFNIGSIYDLNESDKDDLILCCEVLEHLEYPEKAILELQKITKEYIILSVPREPIWMMLNMLRGKYLKNFGNTYDHIQHWSSSSFIKFVSKYFDVIEVKQPLPWTIILCKVKNNNA